MKLLKITHVLILFGAILIFASCSRNEDLEPEPEDNTPAVRTAMKDFFTKNTVASQFFTIDASSYQRVKGNKGTVIDISPGSFLDANGAVVTGNVQLELKEIYSKADMILSNATTTSGGKLLESGGEIYLDAKQNNLKLKVNPSNPPYVNFPAGATIENDMLLFNGSYKPNTKIAAGASLEWALVDTGVNAQLKQDSAFGNSGIAYSFTIDSMGWTNCDRFYGLTGGTDPQIELPAGFTEANTTVMMVFKDENVVASADIFSNQIYSFHSGTHTPIGLNVIIVAIAKKDDKFYYDINPEVTSAGLIFKVNMVESTEADIKTAINAL